MNLATMIKRLQELAAMDSVGGDAPVFVRVDLAEGSFLARCRPEAVEVVDCSFIENEYARYADNNDEEKIIVRGVAILDCATP